LLRSLANATLRQQNSDPLECEQRIRRSADLSRGRVRIRAGIQELVVVIAGVLIALGVDSWWQSWQDRGRIESYVEGVRAETQDAIAALQRAIDVTQASVESLEAFYSAIVSDDSLPDTLSTPAILNPNVYISTASIAALIETGDLNLLENDVRREVVLVSAAVQYNRALLSQFQTASLGGIESFMAEEESIRIAHDLPAGALPPRFVRESPRLIAVYRTQLVINRNQNSILRATLAEFESLREVLP